MADKITKMNYNQRDEFKYDIYRDLSAVYGNQDQITQNKQYCQLAEHSIKRINDKIRLAKCLASKGYNKKLEDYDEALNDYNESLKQLKELLGNDNEDIALVYDNIANVYYRQGNRDEAIATYGKSLQIRGIIEENLTNATIKVANTFQQIAAIRCSDDRHEEAMIML
ncbi:uncharacterized protein TRIADDRAFT_54878 [Trichoplax adhaerens]|uniref:Uncharacterized protein n=1 Tax=Trichoplax adhaerens TaxID=10228 RepID=B3RT89_TRIAD|nr:hypothetical protein TRIADDRAFT_54878 [Trichoplax adhaerens]EDV27183.1 hypothetical protein TRIADDRAFT_54878 [Trichoplax adhaerens]|eukprot:XP_002111179.1 hypothetical protein TRIADDRAFT_54878 [Trichoplax adhaerens]